MKKHIMLLLACLVSTMGLWAANTDVKVGAERSDVYLPLLKGKRVALFSNHTGMLPDGRHTLDVMLENGIDVVKIFSPEHGFRGTADAGEHVSSGVDAATGLPIVSLYDKKMRTSPTLADSVDVIVCDIQDVGLRFYTYYCTMLDLMNVAGAAGKEFMVLDRPNPNGMYVDGPLLDMKHTSGVGRLPIPVVHGMTLGELAQMIIGEGWLNDEVRSTPPALTVVPCLNYTHATRYALPVAPSPNLRTMHAIYLYPSTCLFEGTPLSLGRGTDRPFEMYGHPKYRGGKYKFTPRSLPGAKNPPLLNQKCRGVDLGKVSDDSIIARGFDLSYIIDAYQKTGLPADQFFTKFFVLLTGRDDVARMVAEGRTADEIKAWWMPEVEAFKKQRKPYLLYAE